jgi:hypothetical protein
LVKRSCIIVATAALAFALAAPGVAHAGWSWNEGATLSADTSTTSDPAPDGWSWGDDAAPADPAADPADPAADPAADSGTPVFSPDGWSWGGESSQPSPDGWTWGE